MRSTRPVALGAAWVCLAFGLSWAKAAPEQADEPMSAKACLAGQWRLEGAPKSASADASFVPEWAGPLAQVRACVKQPALAEACAEVQGQYDASKFSKTLSDALGGDKNAQLHRARARALRVKTWLSDAGVPPQQLRERMPSGEPTWRGVLVRVVPDCIKSDPKPTPDPQPPVIVDPTVTVNLPAAKRAWWLAAGIATTGLLADGVDNGLAGDFGVGLGWTGRRTYARLDVAITLGTPTGQTRGLASGFGLGWRALYWLEVGARFGHRISGADYADPWADQVWYGAVESAQCLRLNRDGLRICGQEFLGGGRWITRTADVGDTQYFVPKTDRGVLVLGALLGVRQAF